jgi:hypothetical protein
MTGRGLVSHAEAAGRLRSQPWTWLFVGCYPGVTNARAVAADIAVGKHRPAYRPPGSFEACTRVDGDETAVYARFVGTVPPPMLQVPAPLLIWLVLYMGRQDDALDACRQTVTDQQAECPRRPS